MIEDLKHKFESLGDDEKIEFMKLIMPSFREIQEESRKDDGRDGALLRGHDEVVRYGYAGHDENDGHDGQIENLTR